MLLISKPEKAAARPILSHSPDRRRATLRHATAGPHEAVEAILREAGCFVSAAGYRRYLHAVAPVYAGIEAALEAAGAGNRLPDWPARRKLPLIRREIGPSAVTGPAPDEPAPWSAGDILGALYVTEGATLGGALLLRGMRDRGIAMPAPCLLDPYGAGRGRMWRGFLAQLEAAALTPSEEDAMRRRAGAAFALFHHAVAPLANLASTPE